MEDRVCCTYAQEGPDFERGLMEQEPIPLTTLGQVRWTNNDKDTLSISTETNAPISGNASLRVDVQPADFVNETVDPPWSVIFTDFIPVKDYADYNYSLDVSARDVNQLHSKVYYYDSDKKEIFWEYYIFGGKDGTFEDTFTSSSLPPKGAEYLKLQMWVRQSLKPSSYLIDNIKIEKVKNNDQ